jgi:hypothetical protein
MSKVPGREEFKASEWRVIEAHRTPMQVQRLLTGMKYNRELEGGTLRSFREVLRRARRGRHLRAARLPAAALEP